MIMKTLKDILNRIPLSNLKKEEKGVIRARLVNFMKKHPLPYYTGEKTFFFGFLEPLFSRTFLNALPAALIFALIIGGSVSFAAEGALPGDLLYPVKVSVNEPIRGALVVSNEAKVEWNSHLVERRLEEAEILANRGELDEETRSAIESHIETHIAEIENYISAEASRNTDTDTDSAEVSSKLETTLRGHEQVLLKISAKEGGEDTRGEVEALANKVRGKAEKVSKTRTEAEIEVSGRTNGRLKKSAEGALRSAESRIAEAQKFSEKNTEKLNAEASAAVEAKINSAEETVFKGKAKIETEGYGEAFILFQEAQRLAEEARLTARAARDFNVSIDIEPIDMYLGLDAEEESDSHDKVEDKKGKNKDDNKDKDLDIELESGF